MFVKQFVKVIKSTNDVGKLESSMRYYYSNYINT